MAFWGDTGQETTGVVLRFSLCFFLFHLCHVNHPRCTGPFLQSIIRLWAGMRAGIGFCSTCGRLLRLGRLFNLPVASFPHLLRGDNVLEGDLSPWDAGRLIDLMPLLLTLTEDGRAEPAADQAQNKLNNDKMHALWDLGLYLLCCPWHRGSQVANQGPLGFPLSAVSGGWGLEDENGIWRTSGPVVLKRERPDSCGG